MKLIIDIPEEDYKFIKKQIADGITNPLKVCIANGVSTEQEPKTGHWIIVDDCEKFIAKCSECGRIEDSRMIKNYPYCHCGAKMGR